VTNLTGTASININGTVGATTASTGAFTTLAYTGTLTGGTGVINIGSGQLYKDASGNVGIGTSSPTFGLDIGGNFPGNNFRITRGTNDFRISLTNNAGGEIFVGTPVASPIVLQTNAAERMRITSAGNVGIGTSSPELPLSVAGNIGMRGTTDHRITLNSQGTVNTNNSNWVRGSNTNVLYNSAGGTHSWEISGTERMRIDSSGNLLVGTTSASGKLTVEQTAINTNGAKITSQTFNYQTLGLHNKDTSGDNSLVAFTTDASSFRGSITYNRAGGLVAYNTTSDYRAKDISGPITDIGALIDSVPVYMGKMKGATQERPMFIAHEVPAYAHTGEKDAVDAEGNPVYQQMDASALIPVMWAEIQSLRKRLAAANI
jgi:hypothetical protein